MAAGIATDRWKRTLNDYVDSADELLKSVVEFGVIEAVPIDPNGELLNGSHRVACAIACNVMSIPVARKKQYIWAPPWDMDWFIAHNMMPKDINRLVTDWMLMNEGHGR